LQDSSWTKPEPVWMPSQKANNTVPHETIQPEFASAVLELNCWRNKSEHDILRIMDTYTVIRTSVRKLDERRFHISGHTAWVCRLVADGSKETAGVRLRVLRPFATSPNDYFTDDGGKRFVRVSNFAGEHGLDMSLGENEPDPKTLTTLRQVLNTWEAASGHGERRAAIRETCIGLRALLASLTETSVLSHLQDVGRIQNNGQCAPDLNVQDVIDELAALLGRLARLEAADGEKILSPQRFEKFLSQSLPQ
jgi:hypothetical protein